MKNNKQTLRITDTTDGKYVGCLVELSNPLILDKDTMIYYERVIQIPSGLRLASSSYIIDTVEIK